MTRGVRAARGTAGAAIATILAAASHSLAGGDSSWFAVVATAVLALPLCTLLAGKVGSLWRLGVAVVAAQFPFHWALSGLGTPGSGSGPVVSPHAAHLAAIQEFVPGVPVASLDAGMWLAHGIAAALTIALLHAGERAFLGLARLIFRALAVALPAAIAPAAPDAARRAFFSPARIVERLLSASAITHRGPPVSPA
ncbi:hypothetical protein [Leucobacter edaphi]|uniref:hypothetical protein n=1 Tax=Leucobacter edaphi TaxID=2796472 RepID=UPI001F2FA81B|nr:hypothetical protein [Leucobacter edaphi]